MVVLVPFQQLMGGKPVATLGADQLLGIQFAFADPMLPYDVDVKLDDVRFYGMDDAGAPIP
jgi:hypothetical protein